MPGLLVAVARARPADGLLGQVIDDTYGHLARDFEGAVRHRLEARSRRSGVVRASGSDAGEDA